MRKLTSIVGMALASTLSIASVASPAQLDKPPTSLLGRASAAAFEADVRAIGKVRECWLSAVNSGDVDALLAVYGPGAVLSSENAPPLLGAGGISEWHRRFNRGAEVQYELDANLVQLESDLAVEEWAALVTLAAPPDRLAIGTDVFQYRQSGIRVYRKDGSGHWRIDRETWSADPPGVWGYERRSATDGCPWRVC
jgi:ketosteroid isomerase-like protein